MGRRSAANHDDGDPDFYATCLSYVMTPNTPLCEEPSRCLTYLLLLCVQQPRTFIIIISRKGHFAELCFMEHIYHIGEFSADL